MQLWTHNRRALGNRAMSGEFVILIWHILHLAIEVSLEANNY